MEVDLGPFKYPFMLESLYGTSTVSIDTLEQSKLKVGYAYVLLFVYIVEIVAYPYSQVSSDTPDIWSNVVNRCVTTVLVVFNVLKGIYDYKTKLSAALDLEALQNLLEYHSFSEKENHFAKWAPIVLIVSQSAIAIHSLYVVCFEYHEHLQATQYFTAIHFSCLTLLQVSLLVMLLTKVALIQRAIRHAKLKVIENNERVNSLRASASCGRRRRRRHQQKIINDLTEGERKLLMLTDLEGHLILVEDKIFKSFWLQVVWVWITMGSLAVLFTPSFMSFGIVSPSTYFRLLLEVTSIISIVYVVEKVHQGKSEAHVQLTACREGCQRNRIQLLANIHRSRRPFSCALFDVNYALLFQIMEFAMFVITSLFGNTANNH